MIKYYSSGLFLSLGFDHSASDLIQKQLLKF